MATHKIDRISEDVRRELTDIFRMLKDPRITGMLSIVHVEVTNDLSYARSMSCLLYTSIPKEIRRTMRIREGDPLEIYTDNNGEVIFKKYSPIEELSTFACQYAEVLAKSMGMPVIITDRDHVVAANGDVYKRQG